MKRNIEIKARIKNAPLARLKIESLCASTPERLFQEDIYFNVSGKRKKLRVFNQESGQIIEYIRANTRGPKLSTYSIVNTRFSKKAFDELSAKHGVSNIVRKDRLVYMYDRTRIHLDTVAMLGHFIELEVVLREDEMEEDGVLEAHNLINAIGLEVGEFISCSYLDLIEHIPNNKIQPTSFVVG